MENINLVGSLGRRKAIEELEKGRDFAKQLRLLINGGGGDGGGDGRGGGSENLVKKVLMSFTNSLMILTNPNSHHEAYDHVPSSCMIKPTKSEDSLESNCKSSTHKERRGCYKRRRNSQTLEKESECPIDDGRQWRKYGQKVILNAKHPRNYYRCTHKFDQGCQATKQVQKVQDEPPLYRTTYYGHHTCRNLLNPEIILDNSNSPNSNSNSVFLSFDNTIPTKQECPMFLSSSSVKKECKEEIPSSSSNDYNMISSELTFDNSNHCVTLSSTHDSDDVISHDVLYDSAQLDDFEPFFNFS